MPCWSVLRASVNLGKVDPKLLEAAALSVGYTLERLAGGGLRLLEAGTDYYRASLVVLRDGTLQFKAGGGRPVTWGARSFDVGTEAGRVGIALEIRRAVAVQAIRAATAQAGARVESLGGNMARVILSRGGGQ
jgi:hypothetical protein